MPWTHCGELLNDDVPCPTCGHEKESYTIYFDKPRTFVVGKKKPWPGDEAAQIEALQSAHEDGAGFCEVCQ